MCSRSATSIFVFLALTVHSLAADYALSTVAGYSWIENRRSATAAPLRKLTAVAGDKEGNIYAALAYDRKVIRIGVDGLITVVAGTGEPGVYGDGGPAIRAKLEAPGALALDSSNGLLIGDGVSMVVRRVNLTTGIITTIAGVPYQSEPFADGGPATAARISPSGLAVDPAGNVYVSDSAHSRIRKVSVADGSISTFAGNGSHQDSGEGGPANLAGLPCARQLDFDAEGSLYINMPCVTYFKVKKVEGRTGIIRTIAGIGAQPHTLKSGPAVSSALYANSRIAVEPNGDVWLITGNYLARISSSTGQLDVLGGDVAPGFAGDGGALASARFSAPTGAARAQNGDLLIADAGNGRIRRLRSGMLATVAGRSHPANASPTATLLYQPQDVLVTSSGVLAADYGNGRIRKIVGNVLTDIDTQHLSNFEVSTIAEDPNDRIYAGVEFDAFPSALPSYAKIIRRLANGTAENLAGVFGLPGQPGHDGPANNARIVDPKDLLVSADGTVFISDSVWIRSVDRSNIIRRLAGNDFVNASGEDVPATQSGMVPQQMAFDSQGNLLFADSYNHIVRKLNLSTNRLTTVAGVMGRGGFSGDGGPAGRALLNNPIGLAIDSSGAIYIGDFGNSRVRVIRDGIIDTIAGNGRTEFDGETGPALCVSIRPLALSTDAGGIIYIADARDRIRKLSPTPAAQCPARTPLITSVRSATDFGGHESFSSGSWIELKGADLARVTRTWAGTDFQGANAPTSLSGTSVTINGKSAYVAYVSPTQINVQAPADSTVGPVEIVVSNEAGRSDPFLATKVVRSPGLLSLSQMVGTRRLLVAQFPDGGYVGPPNFLPGLATRPVRPGDSITFFGIGFGDVFPAIQPGQIPQGTTALNNVTVRFLSFPAEILYAGLTPGVMGLYQFNVKMPRLFTGAGFATVSVTVGGVTVPQALSIYFEAN